MQLVPRRILAGLAAVVLLATGLAGIVVESASAAGTLPTTINEVVSTNGTLNNANCPGALQSYTPTPTAFSNLQSAVTAATSGQTIYICVGAYLLDNTSQYGTNEDVVINKALTIDGYNWNVAPAGSDTSASVNSSTQSVFETGSGFLVESPNVTINGLTFYENSANGNTNPGCFGVACGTSIDVQSFITGPGDQGESDVVLQNNLFADTGGGTGTDEDGMVRFGLGEDYTGSEPTTDVTALDSGDQVLHNVFVVDSGFENNALQMSDTTGGNVQFNTVNYASVDDASLSALWFPGFDPSLVVENNTLNGGGIDSDSPGSADTADPKSGIKLIDADANGTYGNGCSGQQIENNTITGFVYDISVISLPYDDTASGVPCGVGPTAYTVSGNSVSHATLIGIYVSNTTAGTITENVASDNGLVTTGHYDYTDNDSTPLPNSWTSNFGNGVANPSSISDTLLSQTVSFTSTAPTGARVGGTYTPTASATSGLTAAITVDAGSSSMCSIAGGLVTFNAVGTCVLDANQSGNGVYAAAAQVQQSITVSPALLSQTVSFTSTAPTGARVGGTYTPTASATSGLTAAITVDAGSSSMCSIAGGLVTFNAVGTCVLDANQSGNGVYAAAAQVQQSITVSPALLSQTVSFTSTAPTGARVGGTYTPTASATSGLTAAITVDAGSSSMCSIAGGLVTFNAVGTCVLDANQSGNGVYAAAAQVQQSITVSPALLSQTVSFTSTAPTGARVGGTYTPTASATSGLTAAITVDAGSSSMCSIAGGLVTFNAVGTCVLDANQSGNGVYAAAAQVQQSITVSPALLSQTVSFTSTAPTGARVGGTYTPTASATSGLTAAITVDAGSSSMCSIAGGLVTFNAVGTCVLDANQSGNGVYAAAAQVQQSITVSPALLSQTVSFTSTAPTGARVGGTYTPTASATSGLTAAITVDAGSSSMCSIAGGLVTFNAVGTCVLDANQSGNGVYAAAAQVQQSITVSPALLSQTVSFTSTAPTGARVGGTYTPTASATSGLTAAITVDAGSSSMCSIAGGLVTFNAVGTCVLDANQSGNGVYAAAAQVQQSITVSPVPHVAASPFRYKPSGIVTTTISCASASCSGLLKLTSTTTRKTEIGKTKRYKVQRITVTLGSARYSLRAGSRRLISIRLSATGREVVRATTGSRFSCHLAITTGRSTENKTISFTKS